MIDGEEFKRRELSGQDPQQVLEHRMDYIIQSFSDLHAKWGRTRRRDEPELVSMKGDAKLLEEAANELQIAIDLYRAETGGWGTNVDRLLQEDERSKKLARDKYQDTELEAKLKGPDVTADEYYERVKVSKLALDSNSLYGWQKLQLPADPAAIDQFISVLIQANGRLKELEQENELNRDWRCSNCGSRPRLQHEDEPGDECRHCGTADWYVHTETDQ